MLSAPVMSQERTFIDRLRGFARHPAARGLADDCAVLPFGNEDLVLTHDMLVEGVHYLADDPPEDVAWKLVAVNLSDLAAKGARPIGALLGYPLGDSGWDTCFADGLERALAAFDVPLLGGDTVTGAGPRQLGLTAIGTVPTGMAPARSGARAGDLLCVTGTIGAAGLGLHALRHIREGRRGEQEWVAAYRRPRPRLAEGRTLAPLVHAMADISDGLLIDAARMAEASRLGVDVALDRMPLPVGSPQDRAARIAAATAGDDYELVFAWPAELTLPQLETTTISIVGSFRAGEGLTLSDNGIAVPLPPKLGYEHGAP